MKDKAHSILCLIEELGRQSFCCTSNCQLLAETLCPLQCSLPEEIYRWTQTKREAEYIEKEEREPSQAKVRLSPVSLGKGDGAWCNTKKLWSTIVHDSTETQVNSFYSKKNPDIKPSPKLLNRVNNRDDLSRNMVEFFWGAGVFCFKHHPWIMVVLIFPINYWH